jgi:hypothetical protein
MLGVITWGLVMVEAACFMGDATAVTVMVHAKGRGLYITLIPTLQGTRKL